MANKKHISSEEAARARKVVQAYTSQQLKENAAKAGASIKKGATSAGKSISKHTKSGAKKAGNWFNKLLTT